LCPEILTKDEILGEKNMRFMGIYSRNREEWIVGSIGCQMDSITIVTLYDTLGFNSIEFILKQTELTTMIVETKNFENIIKLKEQNKLGKVTDIIYLNCNEEDKNLEKNKEIIIKLGINLISYETVISTGKKCLEEKDEEIINKPYKRVKEDDIFLICYSSGTVDNPKGAMVSTRSLTVGTNVMMTIGWHFCGVDRILSFLPLAHIMEQLIFSVCLVYGTQTGFSSGDTARLLEDVQYLQPTYFCAVPRVYEKIYKNIMDKISSKGALVKKIFDAALNIKIKNYEKYGKLNHAFFDPIFFNKIRNLFGGKMCWMLSGGAALQKDILQGMKVMVGCPLVQGYGQTENAGSALLNSIYDTSSGTTGGLQNTAELKLVDLPEFGYYSTDVNPSTGISEPRGEICFRGDTVFKGYFKNIEETKKIFDEEGWYHSGDVGVILTNSGNSIKIIDRAKNLFKLSQGEFVAPDKIQTILINSKYINQIFIYGESQYSYAIALVYPELNECVEFLRTDNKMGEVNYGEIKLGDLCKNKIMEEEILKDCEVIGRKFGLKGFEIPKKIKIIEEAFTLENNLMTPTLKLKVKNIRMKYSKEIQEMYNENI
jgi:long-chain acyl-CoA synthetase